LRCGLLRLRDRSLLVSYQPSPKLRKKIFASNDDHHIAVDIRAQAQKAIRSLGVTDGPHGRGEEVTSVDRGIPTADRDATRRSLSTPVVTGDGTLADKVISKPFGLASYERFDNLSRLRSRNSEQAATQSFSSSSRATTGTPAPMGISNGDSYSDLGYQNTWDVTRAQAGTTGIMVNYSGATWPAAFAPSTPYSNATQNRKYPCTRALS